MRGICSFAGHGNCFYSDEIYKKIISCIKQLIIEKNICEFWVGNYGSFDKMSARAVRMVKKEFPHIKLCLVIPYITSELNKEKYAYENNFDEIIIPETDPKLPRRLYILFCNRYMVEHSSALICYVKRNGGAAQTMHYAVENNVKIINVAD